MTSRADVERVWVIFFLRWFFIKCWLHQIVARRRRFYQNLRDCSCSAGYVSDGKTSALVMTHCCRWDLFLWGWWQITSKLYCSTLPHQGAVLIAIRAGAIWDKSVLRLTFNAAMCGDFSCLHVPPLIWNRMFGELRVISGNLLPWPVRCTRLKAHWFWLKT